MIRYTEPILRIIGIYERKVGDEMKKTQQEPGGFKSEILTESQWEDAVSQGVHYQSPAFIEPGLYAARIERAGGLDPANVLSLGLFIGKCVISHTLITNIGEWYWGDFDYSSVAVDGSIELDPGFTLTDTDRARALIGTKGFND